MSDEMKLQTNAMNTALAVLIAIAAAMPAAAQINFDWSDTYGFEAPRPDSGRGVVAE